MEKMVHQHYSKYYCHTAQYSLSVVHLSLGPDSPSSCHHVPPYPSHRPPTSNSTQVYTPATPTRATLMNHKQHQGELLPNELHLHKPSPTRRTSCVDKSVYVTLLLVVTIRSKDRGFSFLNWTREIISFRGGRLLCCVALRTFWFL